MHGKDLAQGFGLAERFGLNNHPCAGRNAAQPGDRNLSPDQQHNEPGRNPWKTVEAEAA